MVYNKLLSELAEVVLWIGADVYKRCQVGELCFTEFVEAPIRGFSNDGVEIDRNFIFPDVMTLENSIQKNIETLRNWSS